MIKLLSLALSAATPFETGAPMYEQQSQTLAPSAQVEAPPSPSKLNLIRRFLRAIGRQEQLDTGSFLERYAVPGGPMWLTPAEKMTDGDLFGGVRQRMTALKDAFAKHRAEYQRLYEGHVNWEFAEAELARIVSFLESPVGKHFLDGRSRMDAYVGTDTEELEQRIVNDAMASLNE